MGGEARGKRLKSSLVRLLLPAAVVIAALVIQFQNPLLRRQIRNNAFDELQTLFPAPNHAKLPVRVVAIDEASLKSIGQWPWPRTVLAKIVDRLADMGAAEVVFDVVFAEPDRTSPEQVIASWPKDPALEAQVRRLPSHDQVFADSLMGTVSVLGFPLNNDTPVPPLPRAKAGFDAVGGDPRDWLRAYRNAVHVLPVLDSAAMGIGAVSLVPDSDGILRSVPLLARVQNRLYPTLGLSALRLFLGFNRFTVRVAAKGAPLEGRRAGIQGIGFGKQKFFRTMPDGRIYLHFHRFDPNIYIPAKDVLAGKVPASRVNGDIVFVAASAAGLGDVVRNPMGEAVPGVEGHVELLQGLLSGNYLLRPAWVNNGLIGLLLVTWLAVWLLLARFRPVVSVAFTVLVVAALFPLAAWLLVARHLLLDPLYPALCVSALFASLAVPRYLETEREQRWIRNAFSRYVSPNRVKHLQEHPEDLELGGTYRECTFVMTDLAGFTTLMETHDPRMLAGLLNDYLDGMIQVAFSHDGTLDRIVGDAVAVMFSAPVEQPDHAARALACAREMDAFADRFMREKRAEGIPFGKTRVGVNTGQVLVGNFGGKVMLDYRALGDAINTAARLETVNNHLGTRVCVSHTTVEQCPDFVGRPAARLVLKGKKEEVLAFEPLSAEEHASARVQEYLEAYALMEAESEQAPVRFQLLAERYPDDPLAALHARRLAEGERTALMVMTKK